jgi:hypothetical protein
MNLSPWATDAIHLDSTTGFSWKDCLKILIGGRLIQKTQIDTEHKPGRTKPVETVSFVHIPWWPRRRRIAGYEVKGNLNLKMTP